MTRILHLSDLHFGADEPALIEHFLRVLPQVSPDLIVISGDLTQRARAAQFARARAFVAALGAPVLAVPGNHDMPLGDLWARLCDPWRGWRGLALAQVWADAQVVVAGVNSADPLAWKRGRFTPAAEADLARAFAGAGGRLRLAVMHHPLDPGADEPDAPPRGAGQGIQALARLGVAAVLVGHLHRPRASPLPGAPGVVQIQAGSAISWRRRGAPNGFNVIETGPGGLHVQAYAMAGGGFEPGPLWP